MPTIVPKVFDEANITFQNTFGHQPLLKLQNIAKEIESGSMGEDVIKKREVLRILHPPVIFISELKIILEKGKSMMFCKEVSCFN